MNRTVTAVALTFALVAASAYELQCSVQSSHASPAKSSHGSAAKSGHPAYEGKDTWYEFMLKQFNPDNVDYGNWIEQRRRDLIDLRLKNPYFLYSFWITIALLLVIGACAKQWIDRRRAQWITAEMMADLYNQDAYSHQVAQEAVERYNQHIERCNRVIEAGENGSSLTAAGNEAEQLRTDLMRVAEERDAAMRDRDIAREDLRRKAEILADMSVRLEAATNKGSAPSLAKSASDVRGADARLLGHINSLQEQLYAERNSNRRLRGG